MRIPIIAALALATLTFSALAPKTALAAPAPPSLQLPAQADIQFPPTTFKIVVVASCQEGTGTVIIRAVQGVLANGLAFGPFPCDGQKHQVEIFLTSMAPWSAGDVDVQGQACEGNGGSGVICSDPEFKSVHLN